MTAISTTKNVTLTERQSGTMFAIVNVTDGYIMEFTFAELVKLSSEILALAPRVTS